MLLEEEWYRQLANVIKGNVRLCLLLYGKKVLCFLSSDELAICCTNLDFSLPQIGRGVHEPHECKVRYLPLQKYITSASTPVQLVE